MSHLYKAEPNSYDAFGRLRVANPVTLFDSANRYKVHGKFNTYTSGTASVVFDNNTSVVNMTVGTAAGDKVYRETNRVFSYQPGKSLLILTTFTFPANQTNLRCRAGYFSTSNGIFTQRNGDGISFVRRSNPTGTPVDFEVHQQDWLYDKLDGNGPSGYTLDLSKSQIFWTDIEWLGVGSVRCGFVIDGKFIHCHSFHHANHIEATYMQTACLPVRYEIENVGVTASSATLKQICATVITEGGYEIAGKPHSFSMPINAPRTLAIAGEGYPVIAIRLKPNRLDAIAAPIGFSVLGITSANYRYRLVKSTTLTGGTWVSAGDDSNVEYNITATSATVGEELAAGYFSTTNQSSGSVNNVPDLFRYQLERNSFTGEALTFAIIVSSGTANNTVAASIDWQEIT